MKHPEHGYHNPLPGERESMLKNGWVDDVPDEAPPAAQPEPEEPAKRKPGRPPKAK